MKFVLVNTSYRTDTLTVEERYLRKYDENEIGRTDWFEDITDKLSLARIWNSRGSVEWYLSKNKITDHKIISITEEKLFEARLKGI
jgi:hypothetical protein